MSEAYQKMIARANIPKEKGADEKQIKIGKASRKIISIDDDQDDLEDSEPQWQNQVAQQQNKINNVVEKEQSYSQYIGKSERKKGPSRNSMIEDAQEDQKVKQKVGNRNRERGWAHSRNQQPILELVDDEQIDQGDEDQDGTNLSLSKNLSIFESIKLLMGHYLNPYNFPLRRQIPIIANIQDVERERYENGSYISQAFNNSLHVSAFLFFLRAILAEVLLRVSNLFWLIAVILSWVLNSEEQYRSNGPILLGLFLFQISLGIILQYFTRNGRRSWEQKQTQTKMYRVYHYDIEHQTADWRQTPANELCPGNIYKIPYGCEAIPTDTVLLHSDRRIIQVDQSPVLEYLSPLEYQQKIILKQTVFSEYEVVLPLTGVVHYELKAPEMSQDHISGRILLQEPSQQTIQLGYNNILLRGTKLIKGDQKQISDRTGQCLGVVLETGIDSLILKNSQYPFQFRKPSPTAQTIDLLVLAGSVLYIVLVCTSILAGYIYLENPVFKRGYYIDDYLTLFSQSSRKEPVTVKELSVHHLTNCIIVIPILARLCYLLYINMMGRKMSSKLKVRVKDMEMISDCSAMDVLITTISGDLVNADEESKEKSEKSKSLKGRRILHSIRVKQISHNFEEKAIGSEIYSNEDVDMLIYFLSVCLLTVNMSSPTPLDSAILSRCADIDLNIQKAGGKLRRGELSPIKIGQFQVYHYFSIPSSQEYPFKVIFYGHAKQNIVEDYIESESPASNQKILCLVRGEASSLQSYIGNDKRWLIHESQKLHQQRGVHVELVGKFVLTYQQFLQIRMAYEGNNSDSKMSRSRKSEKMIGISKFYSSLGRFLLKAEIMGSLIWENPYKADDEGSAPISSISYPPYKVIIAPPSKSVINPDFDSIHSITNYLLKAFKLPLSEIPNKILHGYSGKETFWRCLKEEKVLVLNGWDNASIRSVLKDLSDIDKDGTKNKNKYGKKNEKTRLQSAFNNHKLRLLGYIEHDEYAWILKETHLSMGASAKGHDLLKYLDIELDRSASTTPQTVWSMYEYARIINSNICCLVLTQLNKILCLFTIEFIHCFFTWGTGLIVFDHPLFLLMELGIALDIFYYFAVDTEGTKFANVDSKRKDQNYGVLTLKRIVVESVMTVIVSSFAFFVSAFSLVEPADSQGLFLPRQFTKTLIFFIIYHMLLFRKLFFPPYSFSLYKSIILLVQILVFYLGLIVISEVDKYAYKGIIWFVFTGRFLVVGIFSVAMIIGVYWAYFMLEDIFAHSPALNPYRQLEQKQHKIDENKSLGSELSVIGQPPR